MMLKTVRITLASFRLSFLVLVCFNLYATNVIAVEYQLLKTIQSFDDVYEKGISSSGSHLNVWPSSYREGDNMVDDKWAYTQSGHQKAILKTARLVPKQLYEGEETQFHRNVFLFDQKRFAKKGVYLQHGVPLKEYTTSQSVHRAILDLYSPDDTTLSFQFDLFHYAMGRGIAKNIDVLETVDKSVEWNGEECVLITGQGSFSFGGPGKWKVHVIPHAAYMIRHAQYLYDGNVVFEVETFGLNRNNDCFFPKESEIKIPGFLNINHKFVFSDVRLEFDSDLFDRVVREFDEELPDGSLKINNSSGKIVAQIIGGEKPHEPYFIESRPIFWRVIALVAVVVVIDIILVALIFYLIHRHRLKKIESP